MSKKFYEITLVNYDENNLPVLVATRHLINFGEINKEEVEEFCRDKLGVRFEAVFRIEEMTEKDIIELYDREENVPVLNPCPFCKTLQMCKENDDWYRENSPRHKDGWHEYKASLVTESYCKNVDWCTGTVSYQPEELNFCPTCGKKIKK